MKRTRKLAEIASFVGLILMSLVRSSSCQAQDSRSQFDELRTKGALNQLLTFACFRDPDDGMFYAMGFTKEFEETIRHRGGEMEAQDKKLFRGTDMLFVVPYKQGIALPSRLYDRSRSEENKWILHFDHTASQKSQRRYDTEI